MSWSTIATTDVLNEFTPQETAALNAIQGATTNLAAILDRTVKAARGAILAGGNGLDQAGTIPDQVRADVVSIARWKWLISFPSLKAFQTKERKDANDDAMKRLDAIAGGHPKIEAPANPIATGPSLVTLPSVTKPHRSMTNRNQEGL